MEKGINIWVLLIVVAAATVIGLNINNSSKLSSTFTETDPYEELRSDNQYVEQEETIKKALDTYMSENFYRYYQTSWFDSVSATGAVINKYGKTFIIQSKGQSYDQQAEEFYGAVLGYFNAKTTEAQYLVDKVILVDQDFNILKETETIKW